MTRKSAAVVVLAALIGTPIAPARAGLPDRAFGPGIDPPSDYVAQSTCDPHVKPGVRSFRRLVMRAYPTTGKGYFVRACSIGATSEHKDGRAWDWMVSAYRPGERKKAERLIDWLLNRDRFGNRWSRARRFGIMYMIWNRRIWAPWYGGDGWDPYYGSSPHTDHIHFSFSWPGARKQTTYWHRRRSFVTAATAHPSARGLWSVTANANVLTAGASDFHGDRSRVIEGGSTTGIAATSTGEGYWLVKARGKVLRYGDAPGKGSYKGEGAVADMAGPSIGYGYWTVTKAGRVAAFGSADHYGSDTTPAQIVAIAATPSGNGYWLLSRKGRVFAFGDAEVLGGLTTDKVNAADIEAAPGGGYWIVTRGGRVVAFGDAPFEGDARDRTLPSPVVSIVGDSQGNGYWLVLARGRLVEFGADPLSLQHAAPARTTAPTDVPVDPAPDEHLMVRSFRRSRR